MKTVDIQVNIFNFDEKEVPSGVFDGFCVGNEVCPRSIPYPRYTALGAVQRKDRWMIYAEDRDGDHYILVPEDWAEYHPQRPFRAPITLEVSYVTGDEAFKVLRGQMKNLRSGDRIILTDPEGSELEPLTILGVGNEMTQDNFPGTSVFAVFDSGKVIDLPDTGWVEEWTIRVNRPPESCE